MPAYPFVTLDVFTDRRFGGNPLAVFTDAAGLETAQMQALAREFNLSETTFVLPPEDPANTARVRIFTPQVEMPFAGHPNVGTAWVLASAGRDADGVLRFEEVAGLVEIAVERKDGAVAGCRVSAPRPLTVGPAPGAAVVAACVGLAPGEVGEPVTASVGASFICAPVSPEALRRAQPDLAAFQTAAGGDTERLNLFLYAREGEGAVSARMFAPLGGIFEDPATGSAAAALVALLLHQDGGDNLAFDIRQGVEMGRPSLMRVTAQRSKDGVRSTVSGGCVTVLRGEATL
jgi:trans-2,3-dihydro-3-hydroxyanthranilate isomerase